MKIIILVSIYSFEHCKVVNMGFLLSAFVLIALPQYVGSRIQWRVVMVDVNF